MIKNIRTIFSILLIILVIPIFVNADGDSSDSVPIPQPGTSGGGGGFASVPIEEIKLTEEGNDYYIKSSRLRFDFENEIYAVQVQDVKSEEVDFTHYLFTGGDPNYPEYYELKGRFSLEENKIKKIDLNEDGYYDLSLELLEIHRETTAVFFLKKINEEYDIMDVDEVKEIEEVNYEELEQEVNDNIVDEVQPQPSSKMEPNEEKPKFSEKIVTFFKTLFRVE